MYRIIHQATFNTPTTSISFVFDSHRKSSDKLIKPYNYSIMKHDEYLLNFIGTSEAGCGILKEHIDCSQLFIFPYLDEIFKHTSIIFLTITETYYVESEEEYKHLKNLSKLNSFLLYDEGWFGEGSLGIDEGIINQVKRLLSTLKKQPEVFPLADGGVQIEWERDKPYCYLEVQFHPDKKDEMEIYYEAENRNTRKIIKNEVCCDINYRKVQVLYKHLFSSIENK